MRDFYKSIHSSKSNENEELYILEKLAQLQISVAYFCSIGLYFLV